MSKCTATAICLASLGVSAPLQAAHDPDVVPGLNNGICNDRCIDYVSNLKTFESLPPWPEIHFSPSGDDTNSGSAEAPLKSLVLIPGIVNGGQVIVYLDGYFIDAMPGGEMEDMDELDLDPPDGAEPFSAYVLAKDPDNPATIDCSQVPAITGLVDHAVFEVRGWVGMAGINFHKCPRQPDANGFSHSVTTPVISKEGARLTIIHSKVTGFPAEHGDCWRNNASLGELVVINSHCEDRNLAAFDEDCATAGQIPSSECASNDATPLPLCSGLDTPYDLCNGDAQSQAVGAVLQSSNGSSTFVNIRKIFNNTQFGGIGPGPPYCLVNDGSQTDQLLVAVDYKCFPPPSIDLNSPTSNNGGFFTTTQHGDGTTNTNYIVRGLQPAWPTGLDFTGVRQLAKNSNSGATSSVYLYQSTLTGLQSALQPHAQFSNDSSLIWGRCNIFDGVERTGGDALVLEALGPAAGNTAVDLDGTNVYDADDGDGDCTDDHNAPACPTLLQNAGGIPDGFCDLTCAEVDPDSFRFGGARYKTAAAVSRSDPSGTGFAFTVNGDFFGSTEGGSEGPLESGGVGIDGNVFDNGEIDRSAEARCAAGEECDTECTAGPLTIPLTGHAILYAPITRANQDITTFEAGTHYTGIGALGVAKQIPAIPMLGLLVTGGVILGAGVIRLRS